MISIDTQVTNHSTVGSAMPEALGSATSGSSGSVMPEALGVVSSDSIAPAPAPLAPAASASNPTLADGEAERFGDYLANQGLSPKTVTSYADAVRSFCSRYTDCSAGNLAAYRDWLIGSYKPATVNLRIVGMNRYLDYRGLSQNRLRQVRRTQSSFSTGVISDSDYELLKRCLRRDGELRDYFAVWTMAATGVRVSELLNLRVEQLRAGFADIVGKGQKARRVWFPEELRREALEWLSGEGRTAGYVFLNCYGERLQANGLAWRLRQHARRYGIDETTVHPHAFRHLMAKKFLAQCPDIAFLADILGHSSVETTRIYLRRTAREQEETIRRVVTW